MKTKFCGLSSLVLVDTLAALPMEHVVRMACLGQDRLRQACSLKWVTERMAAVSFETILKAHQDGNDKTERFCTSSIIKRLNGRVVIPSIESENRNFMKAWKKITKHLDGRLHIHFEVFNYNRAVNQNYSKLVAILSRFSYASQIYRRGFGNPAMMYKLPEMSFYYKRNTEGRCHTVYYRPALLNGRHIADVLRAVCGPADVSEAELDHVRREATERAYCLRTRGWGEVWRGVWTTEWSDVVIVTQV